jgi:hypothetical protein
MLMQREVVEIVDPDARLGSPALAESHPAQGRNESGRGVEDVAGASRDDSRKWFMALQQQLDHTPSLHEPGIRPPKLGSRRRKASAQHQSIDIRIVKVERSHQLGQRSHPRLRSAAFQETDVSLRHVCCNSQFVLRPASPMTNLGQQWPKTSVDSRRAHNPKVIEMITQIERLGMAHFRAHIEDLRIP